MKNIKLKSLLNEGASFNAAGIKAKLKEKLPLAQSAVKAWGGPYNSTLKRVESGKIGKWDSPLRVQYPGEPKRNYDIFQSGNAAKLAKEIQKIIRKYKKHETQDSSVGAAAGWSGSMKSSVSGKILGRTNFSPGSNNSYIIAVTVGGGISLAVRNKMFQELYEKMFVLDDYNSKDGGVYVDTDSGTNYSTIGLASSLHGISGGEGLEKIMNS